MVAAPVEEDKQDEVPARVAEVCRRRLCRKSLRDPWPLNPNPIRSPSFHVSFLPSNGVRRSVHVPDQKQIQVYGGGSGQQYDSFVILVQPADGHHIGADERRQVYKQPNRLAGQIIARAGRLSRWFCIHAGSHDRNKYRHEQCLEEPE